MSSYILQHSDAEGALQIARSRVVGSGEAAAFCNLSREHWRRLARAGKTPAPIRLSARKLGWRVGALMDFCEGRTVRTG